MKQQLGHYDIVAELGRGGMGVVYKGYETSLNRYVAIKVLAESLAHDESVKERFLREARSMAALNDPHIIQIYFIGDDAGQTYFVMEFVDGESLGSLLKREHKLKPESAAKIIHQTALGLATAHDKGVIHRDIKPGNLMITSRGSVKIADFGIALKTQDFSKKLTSTGEFVGTPGYLSPEVCLGKPVDQRSDIFSLGIVLFECLAGRMPFTDESPLGLMLEVVKAEIPDVRTLNAEVDPELSRILGRMIAKEPSERYQSCEELVEDLSKHPLVAKGGPITVQAKMSPAAATMIGAKTPVSGQRPLPSTTPTPRPLPVVQTSAAGAPTTPSQAQPMLHAHEPVLQRQATTRQKSAALPLAIAAILLLGIGGGAYAFRDRIPALKQFLEPAATTTNATTPAPPLATSNTIASTTTTNTVTPPPANSTTQTAAAVAPADTTANAANPATATSNTAATTSVAAVQEPGPAARASQVEPLKELAAAQAAEATPPQHVARVTEPPPVAAPPKPHIPTIAVLAAGDESIAEPAERAIEQALSRNGYHIIDQDMMPRVAQHLAGNHPNMAALLETLARSGRVDAVVVVHARPVGSEQIQYYGQSSALNTAQLNVNVFAVEGQRKLGAGWSEQVHFTSLNAADQAHDAVEPILQQLEEKLVAYRARGNRG
jgi:predicted Ser/Thr protein kinase/cytoskeletal protein RodZ